MVFKALNAGRRTYKISAFIFLTILCSFTTIYFFSCSKKEPPPKVDLTKGFSASVNLNFNEFVATADINRTAPGSCTVVIVRPEYLNGMKLTMDNETVTVSYLGMNFDLPKQAETIKTAVTSLVGLIDNPLGESAQLSANGGEIKIAGTSEYGDYQLVVDGEKGGIKSLQIAGFSADFSNFTFS